MNPNSILLYDLTGSLYERWAHLIEFADRSRAIASGTVAGAPSGLSPCGSQAKPLIDYRKGEEA